VIPVVIPGGNFALEVVVAIIGVAALVVFVWRYWKRGGRL
jgi:hypothetical protein